jgi:hypothetical protein
MIGDRRHFASYQAIDPKDISSNFGAPSSTKCKDARKFKLSPKGSLNSDTRLDTIKSLKNTTFNNSKINKIGIHDYLKMKADNSAKTEPKKVHSSRMKISKMLFELDKDEQK